MARIYFKGPDRVDGPSYPVVWTDGEFDGDEILAARFRHQAEILKDVRLGPPEGPVSDGDHLKTPLGVSLLASFVFSGEYEATGDVPEARSVFGYDGNQLR